MTQPHTKMLRRKKPSKEDVRDALAADWSRCFPPSRRGSISEAMGCSSGTVDNGASGKHIPELHTVLASLLVDPTALQTVLSHFGFKVVPLTADAANDMHTISGMSHVIGQWTQALADNFRDHRETLEIADAIRPLIPPLMAIISEADEHRGVAA